MWSRALARVVKSLHVGNCALPGTDRQGWRGHNANPHSSNAVAAVEVAKRADGVVPVWSPQLLSSAGRRLFAERLTWMGHGRRGAEWRCSGRVKRISPAMIVALVALFVSLAGNATAFTYLVTSKQIKDGTIQLRDIAPAARVALHGSQGPLGRFEYSGEVETRIARRPETR